MTLTQMRNYHYSYYCLHSWSSADWADLSYSRDLLAKPDTSSHLSIPTQHRSAAAPSESIPFLMSNSCASHLRRALRYAWTSESTQRILLTQINMCVCFAADSPRATSGHRLSLRLVTSYAVVILRVLNCKWIASRYSPPVLLVSSSGYLAPLPSSALPLLKRTNK